MKRHSLEFLRALHENAKQIWPPMTAPRSLQTAQRREYHCPVCGVVGRPRVVLTLFDVEGIQAGRYRFCSWEHLRQFTTSRTLEELV